MKLSQAQNLASKIVDSMRDACTRVEIAGSIRRCKPECRDIEIVAIPKLGEPIDLLGEERENLLYRWAKQVEAESRIWWIKPGVEITRADQVVRWPLDPHGKYWRGWLVKAEIKLDLFWSLARCDATRSAPSGASLVSAMPANPLRGLSAG